jgi:predicted nucleic acid-binding protein
MRDDQGGLIRVTHNTREFERVAELKLEDWEV